MAFGISSQTKSRHAVKRDGWLRNAVCLLPAVLLTIRDPLRSRAAHLDLRAHLLQYSSKRFNLLLLARDSRFLFRSGGF